MKDPATWNQLADEIRELRAENAMLRGRAKPDKPLVYIAQPYGGRQSNYILSQKILSALQECRREYAFVSPIQAYGYVYDPESYDRGMEHCISLLNHCDALWIVCDDGVSKGVKIERQYAQEHGMPIKEYKTQLDAVEGKEIKA